MRIGLGTAQFGSKYGISNKDGAPENAEIRKIIERAYKNDITLIDTAPAYGNSEKIIGEIISGYTTPGFRVVTKTPIFSESEISSFEVELLESSFKNSKRLLKQSKIYGLLVHHCDDIFKTNGKLLYDKMLKLKKAGQVEKIGASIYTAEQIDRLMDHFPVDIIQVPVNVFDQRLIQSGHLKKMKKQGIEIHARSVFLQGLLLMNPDELPAYLFSVKNHFKKYYNYILDIGLKPLDAAISFVANICEIDYMVMGVNAKCELDEIKSAVSRVALGYCFDKYLLSSEAILNPSKWDN